MGLKVKLIPSLFKVPSCTQQPKTSSFRLTTTLRDDIFKTINSIYVEQESDMVKTPDSWFTHSSGIGSVSPSNDHDDSHESSTSICGDTHLEEIVRGAQQLSSANHRLFFDPIAEDSPKLGPTKNKMTFKSSDVRSFTCSTVNKNKVTPFKESVAMSMDSEDPYEDFKRSMEEMIASLEVRDDWEELEELLGWYLKVNGRKYHGYIISAFIDLIGESFGNSSNISSDESISEMIGGYNNEIVRYSTSFCSATSSLTSSSPSTSDHLNYQA